MENFLNLDSRAKILSMDGVDPVPVAARYDLSHGGLPRGWHACNHRSRRILALDGLLLDPGPLVGHDLLQLRVSPALGDALKRTGNHDPVNRLYDHVRKPVEGEKSTG